MNNDYKEAVSEVNQIIMLMSEEDREKIPLSFREFIKSEAKPYYGKKIVADIPLKDQNISEGAKEILYFISKKFFGQNNKK